MGRSYSFECGKCGYRTQVAGRPDRGLEFYTQTIGCAECKELYDVVTRLRFPGVGLQGLGLQRFGKKAQARPPKRPPTFAAALNRLPLRGLNGFRWVHYSPRCPVSPNHPVYSWREPGKCPRCGLYLDRGALPFRIWD